MELWQWIGLGVVILLALWAYTEIVYGIGKAKGLNIVLWEPGCEPEVEDKESE